MTRIEPAHLPEDIAHMAEALVAARRFATVDDVVRAGVLLIAAVEKSRADVRVALAGPIDGFGQRYVLDFVMQGSKGSAVVRSAWIIRHGEDFPRFTSCYVL